jgi:N-acyl amino acid synthase of PEP-CTERM/exosortase system
MADGDKIVNCSIILGLMRALVQMSMDYGITDWLAVMEPSLLRLLARFGIDFTPLGPLVEYHGLRQPCHVNFDRLLEQIRQNHFYLWEFVTESTESWKAEKAS